MKNAEQKAITDKLKSILKERHMTYKGLAAASGVPESSVKKIFSGADCSFSRLSAFCESLNISLLQLAASIAQEEEKDHFSFTLEQEKFFAKNMEYFLFFHLLFRNDNTAKQAQKSLNISDIHLWKIVKKLEAFKLLETGPGMKVKFKVKGGLHYLPEGPLQMKILNDVTLRFTEFLVHGKMQKDPVDSPFLRLNFARLTPINYQQLTRALKELHQNFCDVAVKDRKYHSKEELIDVTWIFGLGNCDGMALLRE